MRKIVIGISLLVVSLVAVAMTNSADSEPLNDYIAHEWGTFTSVSGSDGVQLDGLFLEEEKLPKFVKELQIPIGKLKFQGMGLPDFNIRGVNIKMETPVIYFYSEKEGNVDVNVKFKGGIVNQWYPASVNNRHISFNEGKSTLSPINAPDFTSVYNDSLNWKVKVLGPNSHLSYTSPQNLETPTWVNPRYTDANMLQIGKDREKFIFYRGLARFDQPFKVTSQSSSQLTLQNTGNDEIGFAMVYEYTKDKKAKVWWTGKLDGKEQKVVHKKELDVNKSIHGEFLSGLIKAGLYKKEAQSMLETWRHSYFEKEGLRVFWIVPRKFTDEILPISFKPAPKKLERVLVGRSEVLTHKNEVKLVKDFVHNTEKNPYWMQGNGFLNRTPDRFFKAWQSRVQKLLENVDHRFSFLKQISGYDLPFGEYYIDEKKKWECSVKLINFDFQILKYKKETSKLSGELTYWFKSKKLREENNMYSSGYRDRKAVFNMENGELDGECKIYEVKAKEDVLVETKIFKDGKVL